MLLSELASAIAVGGSLRSVEGDVPVTSVVHHGSRVAPGALFCCVVGSRVDGHDLAADAVAAGAAALLVERRLDLPVPQMVVESVRFAMGPVAARFWGDPSRSMSVIGVTGTNGKTTTVAMIAAILRAAGLRCEVLGTLTSTPGGPPTTPDAPELQEQLARWRDGGVDHVVMEVSSHALALGRVDGTWFSATAFTTLGHDHLDLHGDLESYFEAKALLFSPDRTDRAAVRSDDPWGARLLDRLRGSTVDARGYRLDDAVDLRPSEHGSAFSWHGADVRLGLPGHHNVANALCAATVAEQIGLGSREIAAGLASVTVVAGRWERVDAGQTFEVVVDYAHTPDALEVVLDAARRQVAGGPGKVVVVFGCGGDKDRAKRPEMGRIASELADVVVVTSDNPRSEDPEAIIDEILAGVGESKSGARAEVVRIPDRSRAIHHAVGVARDHDVVLIAGKGHETTQVIGERTIEFDDRVVAAAALREVES